MSEKSFLTPKKARKDSANLNTIPRNLIPFRHLVVNRPRIIDWLFEVCLAYGLHWSSILTSLELLDTLIVTFNYIDLPNLHLSAVVCLFVSTKYHEHTPLKIDDITHSNIGNAYNAKQILQQEQCIMNLIWSLKHPKNNIAQGLGKNILDDIIEIYPHMKEQQYKFILRQIIWLWVGLEIGDRKQTIQKVGIKVMNREVMTNVVKIQSNYQKKWGESWINKSYLQIKL